jgi:hypothetical protein
MTEPNRFAITLEQLERTAHVPLEDQVEEQPLPGSSEPLENELLQRQREVRYAGG